MSGKQRAVETKAAEWVVVSGGSVCVSAHSSGGEWW